MKGVVKAGAGKGARGEWLLSGPWDTLSGRIAKALGMA